MIYANNSSGERVAAAVAAKLPRAPYSCPICETAVRLRAGTQRVAHYAHVSKKNCDSFAHEMTPWHLGWQSLFPESEREFVLEADGVKHRTDVFHRGIAVEFQHSPISETEFWRRCSFYTKAARHLVWVFDMRERWDGERIEELGGSAGEENYRWHGHRPTFCGFRPKLQPRITLVLQFEGTDDGEDIDLCEVTNVAGEPDFSYFESHESRIDEYPFSEWIDTILIPKLNQAAVPLTPIVPNIVTHRRTKAEMKEAANENDPVLEPIVLAPPVPPAEIESFEESTAAPQPDFSQTTVSRFSADKCPDCGAGMILRPGKWVNKFHGFGKKKLDPFWGCSTYGWTHCQGYRRAYPEKCRRCGSEMDVVARDRINVGYWRCPKCGSTKETFLKP